jgi:cytochrome c-type biogenesis protein CcmH
MFYLWATLLLAAAAAVVFVPLFRSGQVGSGRVSSQQQRGTAREAETDAGGEATVAALYRDRLQELRAELDGGQVSEADRAVIEAELKAALLADVDSTPVAADDAPAESGFRVGRGLAAVSAALLLASSVLVYNLVGDPLAMSLADAEVVFELDPSRDQAALSAWRERLEARVDARPDDAKSWYLLGHVDLRLARFAAAAEAFSMARQTHGEDPSIDVFWLQARYMAANGQIDDTSRVIAERILARDPNQPLVLEMYAIDAFQRGAFQESVSLLNRALSNALQDNHRRTLEAGLQEARSRLGVLPGAVDVAIATNAQIPAGMTLFVIARPVGGGMPFAVVRRPASGFPRTVRLDDAVSMNPALPLSAAAEIEVVVRLSRSGTAMAHPGDWEWQSEPLAPGTEPQAVQLSATLTPPA